MSGVALPRLSLIAFFVEVEEVKVRSVVLLCLAVVTGVVIGASMTGWVLLEFVSPATDLVYVTNRPITLHNDLQMPAGTELLHRWSAPEGFQQLCLAVNVGPLESVAFDTRRDDRQLLAIPYWVDPLEAQ